MLYWWCAKQKITICHDDMWRGGYHLFLKREIFFQDNRGKKKKKTTSCCIILSFLFETTLLRGSNKKKRAFFLRVIKKCAKAVRNRWTIFWKNSFFPDVATSLISAKKKKVIKIGKNGWKIKVNERSFCDFF